jgi:hypothetical protein
MERHNPARVMRVLCEWLPMAGAFRRAGEGRF